MHRTDTRKYPRYVIPEGREAEFARAVRALHLDDHRLDLLFDDEWVTAALRAQGRPCTAPAALIDRLRHLSPNVPTPSWWRGIRRVPGRVLGRRRGRPRTGR